ncbi:glycosyltransferase [Mitsuaria sp. WAJ17]|uniref:glycosyltransferase n=1 Tax=Mitsuaria sp. WAJ17 TaxID=2761452 RepID=UPI0015FF66D7|nr:glycosyltransferase [Mitsuaria sp. WAJ17]MBB2484306.1 glycosyltransferase [Mitsuaria sp. WAJ17]
MAERLPSGAQAPLHIALCGPVAGADLAPLMGLRPEALPRGYEGAPLLMTLVQAWLEAGHQVTVVTLSGDLDVAGASPAFTSTKQSRLRAVFCPLRPHAWRPVQGRPGRILDLYRCERQALVAALSAAAPDVVHAHWVYEFAWAALDSGLPTLVTSHDSPRVVARMNRWARPTISLYRALRVLMARQVFRRAPPLSVVSPYLQAELTAQGAPDAVVIPNPVAPLALALGRDRERGEALRIAMVCNGWDARKNPQTGLQAFARVAARLPQAELHLFGHGFEPGGAAARYCEAQAPLQALRSRIHCHGPLPHAVLLERLGGLDLLLHPAREETFGMAIAEAMALGLPVLAGRAAGAVPWVLQEADGLADVESPEDLARALLLLAEPARYAVLSRALRASVRERFAAEAVAEAYVRRLRDILRTARRPTAAA